MTTYTIQTKQGPVEVEGEAYGIDENGILTIYSDTDQSAAFGPGMWEFIKIKREEDQ